IKSEDGGATWVAAANGGNTSHSYKVYKGYVYAKFNYGSGHSSNGIYRSLTGTGGWEKVWPLGADHVSENWGRFGYSQQHLHITGDRLFAHLGDAMLLYTDDGENWQTETITATITQ